jgi:hypothetical protein
MNNLENNIALYCVAGNLNEEIEDIQEIFKYLSSNNKKEAINTLEKLSIGYLKIQNEPMQHSFDFIEFYNEVKGRELISKGKIVEEEFDSYVQNCIKNEHLRSDYDFEARELDSVINYNDSGNLVSSFNNDDDDLFDLKHLVFEGYRAQGPGDVIFPPKETSIDNNKIEKLLKNQTFENKLDRIDDISSKYL